MKLAFESDPVTGQPVGLRVDMTEPPQKAERRAALEDQLARATRIEMAYKAVQGNTPDFYALQVLGAALQSGQSSRLYQKLVKEKEMVTGVGGFIAQLLALVRREPGRRRDERESFDSANSSNSAKE